MSTFPLSSRLRPRLRWQCTVSLWTLCLACACGHDAASSSGADAPGGASGALGDSGAGGSSTPPSSAAGSNAGGAGVAGVAGAPGGAQLGGSGGIAGLGEAGSPAEAGSLGEAGDTSSPAREQCVASFSVGGVANPDIGAVLAACPALASALLWVDAQNNDVAYSAWSDTMKQRLGVLYQSLLSDSALPDFVCPDFRGADAVRAPTNNNAAHGAVYALFFSKAQETDLYLASVAHALALEVQQTLPWSLLDYPKAELEPLLSARSLLVPVTQAPRPFGSPLPDADYQVPLSHDGFGFVCDPRVGYRFARGLTSKTHQDLLGKDALETLANLTFFVMQNSVHGFPLDYEESIDTFQMELSERLHLGLDEPAGTVSKTLVERWGCHSTAELLEELARSMNVPVLGVGSYAGAWTDGTSYSFRENSHRGLAYAWTRAAARILPHADFVNATGLSPNYGGPSTPLDYFNVIWRSPASYVAAGLTIDMTLPVVPVLPANSNGTFETYFDFGRVVAVLSDEEGRYTLRTDSCSWDLARAYCINPSASPAMFASNNPYGPYPEFSTPSLVQAAFDDTLACLAKLPGGCSAVPASFPDLTASNYLP